METLFRESLLISKFAGKRILIAGYGREGKSSHALLRRLIPDSEPDIAVDNDDIDQKLNATSYDIVLKSPGIPTAFFDNKCNPMAISSQSDIFLQVYADLTVAVTGTKGKSTTTALLNHALRHAVVKCIMAGNMGIPLFDIIPQLDADTLVVAELSCHQLENIHRAPHVSILLNLFQEHLDHYRDYRDYQMAKLQIALKQSSGDCFLYCGDNQTLDYLVNEYHKDIASSIRPCSLDEARKSLLSKYQFPIAGDHNLSNMYIAMNALYELGVANEKAAEAFTTFTGLEHRLEYVGTYRQIAFYNDSISTIPEAAIAAVNALQNVDTLILGGFDRGIDYNVLAEFLVASSISNLVFVGAAGERIKSLCDNKASLNANVLVSNNYETIVKWCFLNTAPGKICLLSPAAASYDAFTNFEHRGRFYKELVQKYGH